MREAAARRSTSQGEELPNIHLVPAAEPAVAWAEYLRIEPGNYQAYCRLAKWYVDPGFKRWTCILLFDVFAAGGITSLGTIPLWFNGGTGKSPKAGRRTFYFSAWVLANGGPPLRRDRLAPSVFVRRMARVSVRDTKSLAPYSVVAQILEWSTGTPVNRSHSQGRAKRRRIKSAG
jgi:hypothetical protein